jgi:hypothetical protein
MGMSEYKEGRSEHSLWLEAVKQVYPEFNSCHDGTVYMDASDNEIEIDTTKVEEALVAVKKEAEKVQYIYDRIMGYPSSGEAFDMLFRDMTAGKVDKTGEWYKAVAKVKSDNPKG